MLVMPMDPWGSHLPVLMACAAHTTGPVLELGCGDFSTPILHTVCRGRKLVSLENDPEFIKTYLDLRTADHEIALVPTWNTQHPDLLKILEHPWDLAFVDQHPCAYRGPFIEILRKNTKLIVAHDTEPVHADLYGYEPLLSTFKYRLDYNRFPFPPCPWTSAVSDHLDVREFFECMTS